MLYMLLLVLSVLATLFCVLQALARDSFSLWDVGYYICALEVVLCARRLFLDQLPR